MSFFGHINAISFSSKRKSTKIQGGVAYCTSNILQKCLSFAVSLFIFGGMVPQQAFGEEVTSPDLVISSAEQLVEFQRSVNAGYGFNGKTVKLVRDIDLSDFSWTPIGTDTMPFSGTFAGANHTISNLTSSLFGTISGATVKNLSLKKININGGDRNTAGICQIAINDSIITGCVVREGTIKSNALNGGICGKGTSCKIRDCVVIGCQIDGLYGGGICGYGTSCQFANCIVCAGTINATTVGGICGQANSCKFTDCVVSNSSIYSTSSGVGFLSGICAENSRITITNCYSACSYGAANVFVVEKGYNGYFNNELPGANLFAGHPSAGVGLSATDYEKKLREFCASNPKIAKWEEYLFPKMPQIGDFVCTLPDELAYDGKGKVVTIKPKDGITGMGEVTVKYFKVDPYGNEIQLTTPQLPTDAGEYAVKFDVAPGIEYYAATDLPAML